MLVRCKAMPEVCIVHIVRGPLSMYKRARFMPLPTAPIIRTVLALSHSHEVVRRRAKGAGWRHRGKTVSSSAMQLRTGERCSHPHPCAVDALPLCCALDGLECPSSCVCWDVQPLCMLGQSVLDRCSAHATKGDSACSLLLGAHRQGHAIPLSVSGAEVGGGETAYTFRQVDLKEDFLLFMSDTLVITAASQETQTMLGVCEQRCHVSSCMGGGRG